MKERDRIEIQDRVITDHRLIEILTEKENEILKLQLELSRAKNKLATIGRLFKEMESLSG